jgi:hypothetical protein
MHDHAHKQEPAANKPCSALPGIAVQRDLNTTEKERITASISMD